MTTNPPKLYLWPFMWPAFLLLFFFSYWEAATGHYSSLFGAYGFWSFVVAWAEIIIAIIVGRANANRVRAKDEKK